MREQGQIVGRAACRLICTGVAVAWETPRSQSPPGVSGAGGVPVILLCSAAMGR